MQLLPLIANAKRMQPHLSTTVFLVLDYQEGIIEKHPFSLRLSHIMVVGTFPTVPIIPVEAFDSRPVNHSGILSVYTFMFSDLCDGSYVEQSIQVKLIYIGQPGPQDPKPPSLHGEGLLLPEWQLAKLSG